MPSDKSARACIAFLQAQLDTLRSAASAAPPLPSQNSAGRKGKAAIQEILCAVNEHRTGADRLQQHQPHRCRTSSSTLVPPPAFTNGDCFPDAPVDSARRKELLAINGTPMRRNGELTADTAIPATSSGGEPVGIPAFDIVKNPR